MYMGAIKKRALKVRTCEHKTSIRNKNLDNATARHYVEANHGSVAYLKFISREKVTLLYGGGCLFSYFGYYYLVHALVFSSLYKMAATDNIKGMVYIYSMLVYFVSPKGKSVCSTYCRHQYIKNTQ